MLRRLQHCKCKPSIEETHIVLCAKHTTHKHHASLAGDTSSFRIVTNCSTIAAISIPQLIAGDPSLIERRVLAQ